MMKLLSTILITLSSLNCMAQNPSDNTMPFVYHGHIYLQTTVNDSMQVNTLFDTGSDRSYLGIIGNSVWEKFNIIIDAKNQALYLRRHQADEPMGKTYGYGWRNRTDICRGWVVSSMNRSSEAKEAGMEIGDTITAINGRDVRDYTWDEEYSLKKLPRHELDIVTPTGQKKHLTLESKEYW